MINSGMRSRAPSVAGALGALMLLGCGGAASAADQGIYVGGSIGRADVDLRTDSVRIDDDDTAFKLIGGLRLLDSFGIEASYVNLGKVKDAGLSTKTEGLSAFAVGFVPVGPVDLFAKAGLYRWDTKVDSDTVGRLVSRDGTDFAYGLGVQFRLLSLSVRAEYEVFDVDSAEDLNMLSLGLTYTFL